MRRLGDYGIESSEGRITSEGFICVLYLASGSFVEHVKARHILRETTSGFLNSL